MSSRLARDSHGRLISVVTSPSSTMRVGEVFLVLGNTIPTTVNGDTVLFGWLGTSGRPPTAQERAEARAPYQPANSRRRREREDVPDELLADEEAIEEARLEQEREPADLISAGGVRVRSSEKPDTTSTPERPVPAVNGTLATMRLEEARSL